MGPGKSESPFVYFSPFKYIFNECLKELSDFSLRFQPSFISSVMWNKRTIRFGQQHDSRKNGISVVEKRGLMKDCTPQEDKQRAAIYSYPLVS